MTGEPLRRIFLATVQDLPETQWQKTLVTRIWLKQHDFLPIEDVDRVSHGHLPLEGGAMSSPHVPLSERGVKMMNPFLGGW